VTAPIAVLAAALLAPPSALDLTTAGQIDALDVEPNGGAVVFSWTRLGDADLWLADLPAGKPRVLVAEPGREDDPSFSPDGREVAFVGEGVDGKPDIFVVSKDGGTPRNLTANPASELAPRWLHTLDPMCDREPCGPRKLEFLSDRGGRGFDAYETDLDSGTTRRMTRGGHALDVRGDCLRIAQPEQLRKLSEHDFRRARVASRWLAANCMPSWFIHQAMMAVPVRLDHRLRIALLGLPDRRPHWLANDEDADQILPRFSRNMEGIAYLRRTAAASTLVFRSLTGTMDPEQWAAPVAVSPDDGSVVDYAWVPDNTLVYLREHAALPRSLFVASPDRHPSAPWIDAAPSLAGVDLVRPRRVMIARDDGPPLGAWVATPARDYAGRGVVLVRDRTDLAPEAFSPILQFLAGRQYAVVIPDLLAEAPSGPGGRPDAKRWGTAQVEDVTLAASWLAREALAAPARIGVVGEGWFGGYVALAAAADAPDRLRAAVSIGGAADLERLYADGGPEVRARLDTALGSHRGSVLAARSLSHRAATLEAAMFVYGSADPLLGAAEDLRAAIMKRGALAPEAIYPEEGALLVGRRNRADALDRIEDFLMKRL
jgi:dipeptidyl aminopeptidase/acylaminoacyl peptidase